MLLKSISGSQLAGVKLPPSGADYGEMLSVLRPGVLQLRTFSH